MNRFTLEQRYQIIEIYLENQSSIRDFVIFMAHIIAHRTLDRFNKQNCHIWSDTESQQTLQTPLHEEKCNVWCGLHAGGIIGPYLFKNEAGARVTVNGDRYRTMTNDFLFENNDNIDPGEMWFQQDDTSRLFLVALREVTGLS